MDILRDVVTPERLGRVLDSDDMFSVIAPVFERAAGHLMIDADGGDSAAEVLRYCLARAVKELRAEEAERKAAELRAAASH